MFRLNIVEWKGFFPPLQNDFSEIVVLKVFIRLKHDENSLLTELSTTQVRNSFFQT